MSSTVGRLVATAGDMDISGLAAIGYYMRLYAVELILEDSREERSEEQTELATTLLNQVEEYKANVEGRKEEDEGAYTILHDQGKAKVYVLNFAMSLYNAKLKQLQEGNWDSGLRRGLWCCLDLFHCLSKMWNMQNELKDRIKYCKIYLRRIAKETPPRAQVDENELNEMLERMNVEDKKEEEEKELPPEFIDEPVSEPVTEPVSEPVTEPKIEKTPASPASPAARSTSDLRSMMDRSAVIEQIQKKAKYVISALNYEDITTAKQELTSSLSLLQELEK